MTSVSLEDVILLGVVSVMHCFQMANHAQEVGRLRRKYKISPPVTEGPEEFIRCFRAQQNGLEFAVMFEVILWLSGTFCHQVPAAALGLVYLHGRNKYFTGYLRRAEDRVPGFALTTKAIRACFGLTVVGMSNILLKRYAGIDVPAMILEKYYRAM